jgi:anionic cell wall polymer biosynthesis LytR-Cps2A-Psr (LCP) family protein
VRFDSSLGEESGKKGARVSEQGLRTDPTGSDTPIAATDVVTPRRGPPGGGHVLPSKRRRRRWLAAFLVLWAVVAGLMGWAWYQYGKISSDLQVSNARVAPPLEKALTPAPVGAARQTTLVAGVDSHHNVAGTVILARTDSTRHAVEILTVPSTVSLTSGQQLRDVLRFDGVARAIGLLQHDLRVPVNHVLLIQLNQAGSIVRSLGGITITNPTPVPYAVTGGRGVFPAGRVKLTGRTAQWYLDPTERPLTPGIANAGELRQAAVVRGVTDKLVHITTPSAITGVAHTISQNFTTDLSPDPVLSIVAARLGADALIDCRLPVNANLSGTRPIPTVAGFQTVSAEGGCTTEQLQTKLPAAAVAATIIATIVTHGGSHAFYWAVVLAIAIWAFGAVAWILMLPVVRGVRRLPGSRGVAVAATAAAPVPQRVRRTRRRPSLPGLPRFGRPVLPRLTRMSLPHVELPELPRVALPGLPHIGRPELPELRRTGGRRRRRRFGPHLFVRIVSVPASLGLGMLIAHYLY